MSDVTFETPGVLDLSGADTSAFEAIPADRYNATVWSAEWRGTKGGPNAKMPEGTPMLNVQFKIEDESYANRRVFGTYFPVVPEGYDPDKGAKLQGTFVNLLIALGYDEKLVKSNKFKLDLEDMKTRACVVAVGKEPKKDSTGQIIPDEFNNPVKGVKAAGTAAGGTQNSSGLL